MNIAYFSAGHPVDKAVVAALHALGHRVSCLSMSHWRGERVAADLLVIKSWRERQREIAHAHNGAPVLVLDWGYFARVNAANEWDSGYWQISNGALNKLPEAEFPSDRFQATGIELRTRHAKPHGYVLLCGQMPGDGAVLGTNHARWLRKQARHYRNQGDRVVYREHPRGGVKMPQMEQSAGPLDEALAGAKLVVCYNSNVGHDALIAGVPVACDPCAPYAELSGEKCPTKAQRLRYFSRAAYGQWRVSEFAEGFECAITRL